MLNLRKLTIDYFIEELTKAYRRTYGDMAPSLANIIAWSGRLALENIANSDALYHDMEHTILVTLAGQAILEGKHLCEGGVTPRDWMHCTIALLCHDIGYVRGVCRNDRDGVFATGIGVETVAIAPGGTDAALTPYHVDRSEQFVYERFGGDLLEAPVDADVLAAYIEMTRFPVPNDERYKDTSGYGGLIRAADYIGQLGDPDYLRKGPALFYEFEEIGVNATRGYTTPGDLRAAFAGFYWGVVSPYIQDALRYLRQTQEGKEWIARLYSHVFAVENSTGLSGGGL
jgi:hypothetical protein